VIESRSNPERFTRWEIRDDIHHAFVTLGCAVICWRRLRTALCWE
jgi:hypothetical protein